MKDNILFVSVQNVPMIEYDNQITHQDFLKWKDKLNDLGVDVMKIIVYANLEMFSALQRTALKQDISMMKPNESIIPFSYWRDIPIEETLEFTGLNVHENGEVVMKIFVYEVFNDYSRNSRKED